MSLSTYVCRGLCLYTHFYHDTDNNACLGYVGILKAMCFLNLWQGGVKEAEEERKRGT